jgi:uncharacterized protein YhhL (DUF1145 family)
MRGSVVLRDTINWGYCVQLLERNIDYLDALSELVDPHTIKMVMIDKKTQKVKSSMNYSSLRIMLNAVFHLIFSKKKVMTNKVYITTRGRLRYLDIPGGHYYINSDDIFYLERPPGKKLVTSTSYIALGYAGFLSAFGFDYHHHGMIYIFARI